MRVPSGFTTVSNQERFTKVFQCLVKYCLTNSKSGRDGLENELFSSQSRVFCGLISKTTFDTCHSLSLEKDYLNQKEHLQVNPSRNLLSMNTDYKNSSTYYGHVLFFLFFISFLNSFKNTRFPRSMKENLA